MAHSPSLPQGPAVTMNGSYSQARSMHHPGIGLSNMTPITQIASSTHFKRPHPASPSPPLSHPQPVATSVLNKRDKKRMAMTDRLTEISTNFNSNRDMYYRQRLREFQSDIAYITNADLYNNKPLDSLMDDARPENGTEDVDTVISMGARAFGKTSGRSSRAAFKSSNAPIGRHAEQFRLKMGEALETKDVGLVELVDKHNFAIEQLHRDYTFAVAVADREHRRLMETLRQRMINNVHAKKAALQRDKEKLDLADTNALLYHPDQFSMNQGASPAGPQSNRKTRHTRHRQETDDQEGAGSIAGNGKRKRKGYGDADFGSPVRDFESSVNNFKGGVEYDASIDSTPQAYTIDKLFTDRELKTHLQAATLEIVAEQQADKWRRLNLTEDMEDETSDKDVDDEDAASSITGIARADAGNGLEAPAMERSSTNNTNINGSTNNNTNSYYFHATRSAKRDNNLFTTSLHNLLLASSNAQPSLSNPLGIAINPSASNTPSGQPFTTTPALSNFGELAGRQSGAMLLTSIGTTGNGRDSKKNKGGGGNGQGGGGNGGNGTNHNGGGAEGGDDYNRAPQLPDHEALEDFALMAKAMQAEDQYMAEMARHGNLGKASRGSNAGAQNGTAAKRIRTGVASDTLQLESQEAPHQTGSELSKTYATVNQLPSLTRTGTGPDVRAASPGKSSVAISSSAMLDFNRVLLDEVSGVGRREWLGCSD